MKKILLVLLFVSVITFPAFVHAEYKAETRQEVDTMLQEFYRLEQGNRLTPFSMQSLMNEVGAIFEKNVVVISIKKEESAKK